MSEISLTQNELLQLVNILQGSVLMPENPSAEIIEDSYGLSIQVSGEEDPDNPGVTGFLIFDDSSEVMYSVFCGPPHTNGFFEDDPNITCGELMPKLDPFSLLDDNTVQRVRELMEAVKEARDTAN